MTEVIATNSTGFERCIWCPARNARLGFCLVELRLTPCNGLVSLSSCRVLLTGSVVVGEVLPEVGAGVVHIFQSKPWNEGEMRETLERAEAYLDAPPALRRAG